MIAPTAMSNIGNTREARRGTLFSGIADLFTLYYARERKKVQGSSKIRVFWRIEEQARMVNSMVA
jgi:hypothetical protein